MSHLPSQGSGGDVLVRRVARLAAEARHVRGPADSHARLLALALRDQLALAIDELAQDCAVLAGEISAGRLRKTATAAYGAVLSNRRM